MLNLGKNLRGAVDTAHVSPAFPHRSVAAVASVDPTQSVDERLKDFQHLRLHNRRIQLYQRYARDKRSHWEYQGHFRSMGFASEVLCAGAGLL